MQSLTPKSRHTRRRRRMKKIVAHLDHSQLVRLAANSKSDGILKIVSREIASRAEGIGRASSPEVGKPTPTSPDQSTGNLPAPQASRDSGNPRDGGAK